LLGLLDWLAGWGVLIDGVNDMTSGNRFRLGIENCLQRIACRLEIAALVLNIPLQKQ